MKTIQEAQQFWDEGWLCLNHNIKHCDICDLNAAVRVSLNFDWVGKPAKGADGKMYQNGKRKNLGYGWCSGEDTFVTVFSAITENGYSIGPYLKPEADGHRHAKNFLSHSLALVDVDSGMTIDELMKNEFYDSYAAGFYTTPSHTPEHHKFRIIFRLEEDICSAADMRWLYLGLIKKFGGDPVCKDGARLFFGTTNAPMKEIRMNILPMRLMKEIIERGKECDPVENKAVYQNIEHPALTDGYRKDILESIRSIYLGNYGQWYRVGVAMYQSGFTLQEFIYVSVAGLMREKSSERCTSQWQQIARDKTHTISFGYVINLLKQFGVDVASMHGLRSRPAARLKEDKRRLKLRQTELRVQLADLQRR